MEDLMKMDLYEFLNISITAEEKEIKKAYRKKAITCHPDKNPDNPKAVELFQQLSKALEILTDADAKSAYDKVLNARKAAQVRHRELDSKRKKLNDDLEAREKDAQEYQQKLQRLWEEVERLRKERAKRLEEEKDLLRQQIEKQKLHLEAREKYAKELREANEKLRKEVERLRKERAKRLEEEKELLRQQIEKEKLGNEVEAQIRVPRLMVTWESHQTDDDNGGYNQEILTDIFQKYGQVTCVVSSKKNGIAIAEFLSSEAAQQAYESERGHQNKPLTLSWITGRPEIPRNSPLNNTRSHQPTPELESDSVRTLRDSVNSALMKLRKAEKRKRLNQEMMEEEVNKRHLKFI